MYTAFCTKMAISVFFPPKLIGYLGHYAVILLDHEMMRLMLQDSVIWGLIAPFITNEIAWIAIDFQNEYSNEFYYICMKFTWLWRDKQFSLFSWNSFKRIYKNYRSKTKYGNMVWLYIQAWSRHSIFSNTFLPSICKMLFAPV